VAALLLIELLFVRVRGLGSFSVVYQPAAVSATSPVTHGGHIYLAASTVAHGME